MATTFIQFSILTSVDSINQTAMCEECKFLTLGVRLIGVVVPQGFEIDETVAGFITATVPNICMINSILFLTLIYISIIISIQLHNVKS